MENMNYSLRIANSSKLLLLVAAILCAIDSYSFEYRIRNAVADTTLDGLEIYLRDESDVIQIAESMVKDGIMEIVGESDRSFPGLFVVRPNDEEGVHASRKILMCRS